jgi:hypothetical protein
LRQGYSFLEFLSFLESSKLHTLNPHVWVQRNVVEDRIRPDRVINVSKNDLFSQLNAFEAETGMPLTDFQSLEWLKEVERPRQVNRVDFEGDVSSVKLSRVFAEDRRDWPANNAFLNDQTRRLIEKIYAVDFSSYQAFL